MKKTLPRILFFAEAVSLAHVARPAQLATTLDQKWDIHFACANRYKICFKGKAWQKHSIYSIRPEQFMKRLNRGSPLFREDELSSYVKEDLALIQSVQPDIVVGDLRLSLSVAARIANIPYFSICNAHWSPWTAIDHYPLPDLPLTKLLGPDLALPIFRMGRSMVFKMHAKPLNNVRKYYGWGALSDIRFTYTDSDITLFPDTPELVPTRNLPQPHCYLGPIIWSPDIPKPLWWDDLPKGPIAYVTLGSTGQVGILFTILEVLESAGYVTLVATAGRSHISPIKDRRFVTDFLPGEAAAAKAHIVVCNGGSATAYQALSQGKSVLGLCSNLDQFLTMFYIERIGAGLTLRASTINKKILTKAINTLQADKSFQESASKMQNAFARYSIKYRFPRILEDQVLKKEGHRHPMPF